MRFVACAFLVLVSSYLTTGAKESPVIRPHFEVASLRLTAKDQVSNPALASVFRDARRGQIAGIQIPLASPNRVHLQNWPLLDLIAAAYRVRVTEVSGPAWLSAQGAEGFDIEARVPIGTSEGDLRAMLQSLLEERFALKVHRSERMRQGYALMMGKGGSKLTPAALPPDSSRTSEKEGQSQAIQHLASMQKQTTDALDSSNHGAGLTMRMWPSITLEELAGQLGQLADAPVVDKTELTGKYLVTLQISTSPDLPGGTVFDAVEKLGLKLKPSKVGADTVVIDQVSRIPTAN